MPQITVRDLTKQEKEALSYFRMMSPAARAMTLGWMQHRASASVQNRQKIEAQMPRQSLEELAPRI